MYVLSETFFKRKRCMFFKY